QGLPVPNNLSLVRINPLRGRALIVMEPRLLFITVDNYFGGSGHVRSMPEGRESTPTEMRIARLLLEIVFRDMKEAWKPIMDVSFDYLNSEVNPQFANIVSPTEVVVVSTIRVELEEGGGEIHVVMPYSMIEPIRDLLDAGISSDRGDVDDRWRNSLAEAILKTDVVAYSVLLEKVLTVRDVMKFKAGDVIPVDVPETVCLTVEGVPLCRGKIGLSDGNYAIQVKERIPRTKNQHRRSDHE
ncbi:MAG: flagellar motor switch protein FliM, partial [Gammaproteobacteria bacterium]